MECCNNAQTPAVLIPLSKDGDRDSFNRLWEYTTVIGMLVYLSTNSRPDSTQAVNQGLRFTHNLKGTHAIGVRINI